MRNAHVLRRRIAMRRLTYVVTSLIVAGAGAALANAPKQVIKKPAQLILKSDAIQSNGTIATEYTCDGSEQTPPLSWSAPPAETKSIAIVVEDPDAPNKVFTHWVVTGIPAATTSLSGATLPEGAMAGKNDKGITGWAGPCPPSGRHRYVFHVYALDISLSKEMTKADLTRAMAGHVLAVG